MDVARSALVDTLREYLEVHERMTEMFVRYRAGDLDFDTARELVDLLQAEGVRVLALTPGSVRFVTHMDVGPDDVERVARALGTIFT